MSDELVASLKEQIRVLQGENKRLTGENTTKKTQKRSLQSRLTATEAKLASAERERDDYKTKATANPSDIADELTRVKGELRARNHKDGLASLAYSPEVGVSKSVPVDRLMRLLDYKPEADAFDAVAAKQALLGLKRSDAYLFAVEGQGPQSQGAQGVGPVVSPGVIEMANGGAFGRGSGQSTGRTAPFTGASRDPVACYEQSRSDAK